MFRYLAVLVVAGAVGVVPEAARAEAAQAEAPQAQEGFELYNRTRFDVVYAKALNAKEDKTDVIMSEGWYQLAPGKCQILYPGKLKYRYYMIYAEARGSNRKWTGKISVCVDKGDFRIVSAACPASKIRRMFIEVDTEEYETFTYDLN